MITFEFSSTKQGLRLFLQNFLLYVNVFLTINIMMLTPFLYSSQLQSEVFLSFPLTWANDPIWSLWSFWEAFVLHLCSYFADKTCYTLLIWNFKIRWNILSFYLVFVNLWKMQFVSIIWFPGLFKFLCFMRFILCINLYCTVVWVGGSDLVAG